MELNTPLTTQPPEYHEHDLGRAAFLVVKGFRLLGLQKSGSGTRFSFRFEDREGNAAKAVWGYMDGEAVPARALISAEKDLKTLLYSEKAVTKNGTYDRNFNR